MELESEADWQQSVEKVLANQSLYTNVIKEVFNALARIIGWVLISLVSLDFLIFWVSSTNPIFFRLSMDFHLQAFK